MQGSREGPGAARADVATQKEVRKMAVGIIHHHPAHGLALRNFDRLFDEFTRDFGVAPLVRRTRRVRQPQAHFTPRFEAVAT